MSARGRATAIALVLGAVLACGFAATSRAAEQPESIRDGVGLSRGVDRLIAELRERELVLKRRERELEQRNHSLAELAGLVDERLRQLESLRESIERRIEKWDSQDGGRARRLAKVYAAMPAQKVAPLIQSLDLELAVMVVRQMKDKQSAAVLAALPRSRALRISRRILRPLAPPAAADESRGTKR